MVSMTDETSMPPSGNIPNASDDRIHPQQSPRRRHPDYETTADGDVVIVQPSFDDETNKSSMSSHLKHHNWQERSPKQDEGKDREPEPRSPSSPTKPHQHDPSTAARHTRNLSAHFFDATTLGGSSSEDSEGLKDDSAKEESRKHRRMMSGDVSNPNVAHRRLNSVGNTAAISRRTQKHHRVDSTGLDMLSAAADATKDVLGAALGSRGKAHWDQPPAPAPAPVAMHPPRLYEHQRSFPPPSHPTAVHHHRRYSGGPHYMPSEPQFPPHPPPPHYPPHAPPPGYSNNPTTFYVQYPTQHSMYQPATSKGTMYPPESRPPQPDSAPESAMCPPESRPPQPGSAPEPAMYPPESRPPQQGSAPEPAQSKDQWDKRDSSATHQGSQTFVTAMAVGGSRTLRPNPASYQKHVATNTETNTTVPSHIDQHHRQMSSCSSLGLGTIFGPSIMSPSGENGDDPLRSSSEGKPSHHRSTSSTVSFWDVLGSEGNTDEVFLRNLHESSNAGYSNPPPGYCMPVSTKSSDAAAPPPPKGTKLAAGGTSRRVRRKCTVQGCENRVVQGGLCISHGAKRKTCKHPGCTKNVKKAGMCSTHGPARKRCEYANCPKVAVQGGRCIAHGAKKRLCSFEDCPKQAILGGMCKKHHDMSKEGKEPSKAKKESKPKAKPSAQHKKAQHTRGLSIFNDISVDVVQSVINADSVAAPSLDEEGNSQPPSQGGSSTGSW